MKQKYKYIIIILIFSANFLSAEDKSSIIGVHASPVIKPGFVNERIGIITGGRLAVSFDKFIIGAAIYSQNLLKYETEVYDDNLEEFPFLEFTYFGIESEIILFRINKTYLSAGAFGGIAYTTLSNRLRVDVNKESYNPAYGDDYFYIVEPVLYYNYAINNWMHISLGISRRISIGADYIPKDVELRFDDNSFSGFAGSISLRLGIF